MQKLRRLGVHKSLFQYGRNALQRAQKVKSSYLQDKNLKTRSANSYPWIVAEVEDSTVPLGINNPCDLVRVMAGRMAQVAPSP